LRAALALWRGGLRRGDPASLRAALALWRGGLSAQLLTGICDPADSVMSSPITSLLVRQRKRRIQDMYTIENVKDRALKVLVLTMSLAALAAMEYDCGLVRVRHQLTKTGIPRFVDNAWSCIKTSKEDANFLEFTALTHGAFHLLHAHFAPGLSLAWETFASLCVLMSERGAGAQNCRDAVAGERAQNYLGGSRPVGAREGTAKSGGKTGTSTMPSAWYLYHAVGASGVDGYTMNPFRGPSAGDEGPIPLPLVEQAWGEPQYLKTFRAGADPGIILSVLVAQLVGRLGWRRWILEEGLRVGGPGTPPFWRTRDEFCTGP